MKKKFLITLLLCLVVFSLCFFASCDTTDNGSDESTSVKSVTFLTRHEGDYVLGEDFSLSEITFKVVFQDRSTKEVVLTDHMISEEDRKKFFTEGVHTIRIEYQDVLIPLQISVISKSEVSEYKATFFSLGGTTVDPFTTSIITAFPSPEREGFTFDGWYSDVAFNAETGETTFIQDRVKAPYTLEKDTSFYAKWLDNRYRSVTFTGGVNLQNVVLYQEEIHYGESINVDKYLLPEKDIDGKDLTIEGMTFIGWNVTNGNPNKVTTDLVVEALFEKERCNLSIYYIDSSGMIASTDKSFDWGTIFNFSGYEMATKEGHDSRWVVYYNHVKTYECPNCNYVEAVDYKEDDTCRICGTTMEEKGFSELHGETTIKLTQTHTLIQAYHEVKVYTIDIYNGQNVDGYVASKLKEDGIDPNIEQEVYLGYKERETNNFEKYLQDGTTEEVLKKVTTAEGKDFSVKWNGSFDLSTYTQNPRLDIPETISDGYTSQWCFVVNDKINGKDIWYNTSGQIWNIEKGMFEEPETRDEGEGGNYWILYNNPLSPQREYVATIRDGKPTQIKNGITIKAKYIKKDRTVGFRREYNNVKGLVARFSVPYYTTFNLYDPMSYLSADDYVFSPDRVVDTDPAPDPVVREKLAYYEQVRYYELYYLYQIYSNVSLMPEQTEDLTRFYVWLYYRYRLLDELSEALTSGKSNSDISSYAGSIFGTLFSDPENNDFIPKVKGMVAQFKVVMASPDWYDVSNYSALSTLFLAYKDVYLSLEECLPLGYETIVLASEEWGALFDGEEDYLVSCKNAWVHYIDSASYHFYEAQLNRSASEYVLFEQAELYRKNKDDPSFDIFRTKYEKYITDTMYMYYFIGLESTESTAMRRLRLSLVSENDVEDFYLYADTHEEIQSYSGGVYLVAEGKEKDWSISWFGRSDNTEEVYFLSTTRNKTIGKVIKDDTTLYCQDIDNREYEFIFHYGYDFETDTYTEYKYRKYSASVLWENVYTGYYVFDETTGAFVQATAEYDPQISYYQRTVDSFHDNNGEGTRLARFVKEKGISYWNIQYKYFFTYDESTHSYNTSMTYYADKTYYINFKNVTDEIVISMNTVLPEDYNEGVKNKINGINVTYEFIGWFDTPYSTYLTTGYRGEELKVTNQHTENIEFFAHYRCNTEYTVTIYDTTQARGYAGKAKYVDGYAVPDTSATITYKIKAGEVFSLEDVYKGTVDENGNVTSGQMYYYYKRYIEYYDEYYSAVDSLYNDLMVTKGWTSASLQTKINLYQAKITEYREVLASIKVHDYTVFETETYSYYLSDFKLLNTMDDIADCRAEIENYVVLLNALKDKNYFDISSISSLLENFVSNGELYKVDPYASAYKDKWDVFYKNYYVKDLSGNYIPATDVFENGKEYYTFVATTDYDYCNYLITIYTAYKKFLESEKTYRLNRAEYALYPYHTYMNSIVDINSANDYDYEGLSEIKYNFINWYTDSSYSAPFTSARTRDGYYESTEEARLDALSWEQVKSRYYVFNDVSGVFTQAVDAYSNAVEYYEYDSFRYFAIDISQAYTGEGWSNFFTYNTTTAMYESAVNFDLDSVYYCHYRNVTTLVASRLEGWNNNYEKYYIHNGTSYEKASSVFDSNATYYQLNSVFMDVIVSKDITLYAKWMDISRGSEGLVYEKVLIDDGVNEPTYGYVIIDYVNEEQSKTEGYYKTESSNLYLTSSDGNIPKVIVADGEMIELQIPASITGYELANTQAAVDKLDWESNRSKYYIFNTATFTYEVANGDYNVNTNYYDMTRPVEYPVIGVRKNALSRYNTRISQVNLPLNLFFIEEGSFNLCPIEQMSRATKRNTEIELNYIVVDTNNGVGVMIRQKDKYLCTIEGLYDASYEYTFADTQTVIAFAVSNPQLSTYTLPDEIKKIGDYAFRGAKLTELKYFTGSDEPVVSPVLREIGAYAFDNSFITSFTIASSIVSIGKNAFSRTQSLTKISVQDDASLLYVGENAFSGTGWFKGKIGLVSLVWYNSGSLKNNGVLIGYNSATSTGKNYYDDNTYNDDGVLDNGGTNRAITSTDLNDRIIIKQSGSVWMRYAVVLDTLFVSIADGAFKGLEIQKIIIMDASNLQYIGNEAFMSCPNLKRIEMEDVESAISIGKGAFSGKSNNSVTIVDMSYLATTGSGWESYDKIIVPTVTVNSTTSEPESLSCAVDLLQISPVKGKYLDADCIFTETTGDNQNDMYAIVKIAGGKKITLNYAQWKNNASYGIGLTATVTEFRLANFIPDNRIISTTVDSFSSNEKTIILDNQTKYVFITFHKSNNAEFTTAEKNILRRCLTTKCVTYLVEDSPYYSFYTVVATNADGQAFDPSATYYIKTGDNYIDATDSARLEQSEWATKDINYYILSVVKADDDYDPDKNYFTINVASNSMEYVGKITTSDWNDKTEAYYVIKEASIEGFDETIFYYEQVENYFLLDENAGQYASNWSEFRGLYYTLTFTNQDGSGYLDDAQYYAKEENTYYIVDLTDYNYGSNFGAWISASKNYYLLSDLAPAGISYDSSYDYYKKVGKVTISNEEVFAYSYVNQTYIDATLSATEDSANTTTWERNYIKYYTAVEAETYSSESCYYKVMTGSEKYKYVWQSVASENEKTWIVFKETEW